MCVPYLAIKSMSNKNYKQNEYKEIVDLIEKKNRFFHDLILSKQNYEEDVSVHTLDIPSISASNQQKVEWYDSFVRVVLLAKNSELIESAIVHGSFGDFTYTEFSDLEVTLLLSKDVLSEQDKEIMAGIKIEVEQLKSGKKLLDI